MRLFREKQLARVKLVFTKAADLNQDPPVLPASEVWVETQKMAELLGENMQKHKMLGVGHTLVDLGVTDFTAHVCTILPNVLCTGIVHGHVMYLHVIIRQSWFAGQYIGGYRFLI